MAQYLSNELAGTTTGLTTQAAVAIGYRPVANVYHARTKRMRATVTMASQATTDTIVLGELPQGATFAFGVINTTATTATATVAIGSTGTTGKYRAAAAVTAVDTPTLFGPAAIQGAAAPGIGATPETVIASIGTAALPAAGTLVVDIYYSMP